MFGHPLRTQTARRYVVFAESADGAAILRRSNNRATILRERARPTGPRASTPMSDDRFLFAFDTVAGEFIR